MQMNNTEAICVLWEQRLRKIFHIYSLYLAVQPSKLWQNTNFKILPLRYFDWRLQRLRGFVCLHISACNNFSLKTAIAKTLSESRELPKSVREEWYFFFMSSCSHAVSCATGVHRLSQWEGSKVVAHWVPLCCFFKDYVIFKTTLCSVLFYFLFQKYLLVSTKKHHASYLGFHPCSIYQRSLF